MKWKLEEAIRLATLVEAVCKNHGAHVALTGGLLYSEGERKDCDLLFYRHKPTEPIDVRALLMELEEKVALFQISGYGRVLKARWHFKAVDLFFPEDGGAVEYPEVDMRTIEPLLEASLTAIADPGF